MYAFSCPSFIALRWCSKLIGDLLLSLVSACWWRPSLSHSKHTAKHLNVNVILDGMVGEKMVAPAELLPGSPHSLRTAVCPHWSFRLTTIRICRSRSVSVHCSSGWTCWCVGRSQYMRSKATVGDALRIAAHASVYFNTAADPV